MRRPILLPFVVLAACADLNGASYVVLDDVLDTATPLTCTRAELGDGVAISEIRSATDSTWLLLDEPARRVTELDHRLRPIWSMEYAALGPGSVARAASVALLGDTAVAIADRGSLRLEVLSRTGAPIRSTPLDFMPNTLTATPDGDVLITPLRVGDRPETLLVRYSGTRRTDVPVPPRYYEHIVVSAMGNAARVEALPDGGALVLHEYLAPRGFRVRPDGGVEPFAVPTPAGTMSQLDYVPVAPFSEEQVPHIMVPNLGISVDRAAGDVFLMSRSGRVVDDVQERLILRLDAAFEVVEAYTVGISADRMAILPKAGVAVVSDDVDALYTCALPAPGVHAAAD